MRRSIAAVLLVLAATAALADDKDKDFEEKYHRAYAMEVVDGKVADAAKVYLELLRDEKAPARLRAESKFRFGVTAVLLGRPDEAKAYFAEVARDPQVPEALRNRAAEYLDAAKGIGVGGELERKLESMVFDLAKESPWNSPAVYRDVEVIGRRAVPFLRRLLVHPDKSLRLHAYRLLLRLKEPGLMELWTLDLFLSGDFHLTEYNDYFATLPEERPILERKLLALDDKTLSGYGGQLPALSVDFVRAATKRLTDVEATIRMLEAGAYKDEALQRLRVEWNRSDDPQRADAATLSFLRAAASSIPDWVPRAELFPMILDRLRGIDLRWKPEGAAIRGHERNPATDPYVRGWIGLEKFVADLPTATVVQAMQTALIDAKDDSRNPIVSGLMEALALAVEIRTPDPASIAPYAAALRRWVEVGWGKHDLSRIPWHLAFAQSNLPPDEAARLAAWIVKDPYPSHWLTSALRNRNADDVAVAMAAFRAAPDRNKRDATAMALGLSDAKVNVAGADYARAVTAAIPEYIRAEATFAPMAFAPYELVLPVDEARTRLVEAVTATAGINDPGNAWRHLDALLGRQHLDIRAKYWSDVVIPSLDRVLDAMTSNRRNLLSVAADVLTRDGVEASARSALIAFLLAHVELWDPGQGIANLMGRQPNVSLSSWIPRVDSGTSFEFNPTLPPDRIAEAAEEMTRDPAAINASILAFVARGVPQEQRGEIYDRLLQTAPVDRLTLVLDRTNQTGQPAGADAMEAALVRVLGEAQPDLPLVARLVGRLVVRKPSERLIPAIRMLLAQDAHVFVGIAAAESLGREELLPALADKLDSMDAKVRQSARQAIDSIVELRRLREQARKTAAPAASGEKR